MDADAHIAARVDLPLGGAGDMDNGSRTSSTVLRARRYGALAALAVGVLLAASCTPSTDGEDLPKDLGSPVAVRAPEPQPPVQNPGDPTPSSPPAPGASATYIASEARQGVGDCPLFPDDHAFHADIGRLPVRADSVDVVAALGGEAMRVRPAFSAGMWAGSRSGIPVNVVDSRSSQVVNFLGGEYGYLSDLTGHPMPANPRYEGWPGIAWDRHLLVVDTATCISSEFFYVTPNWMNPFGFWVAQTAVKIDLRSNAPRARGATTASGLSMLTGMVRYDEVASGSVDHAIAITLPKIKAAPPVWPAFGTDGRSLDPHAPQMGTWFRLRSDVDLSSLSPQARVVAEALRRHGAVLADTNDHGFALVGEPDTRWDDADLATLSTLSAGDFDVVDPSDMVVDPATMQIR